MEHKAWLVKLEQMAPLAQMVQRDKLVLEV
jgi:hypothetical protein